jgi:predicted MFS family arabinose efflux permease
VTARAVLPETSRHTGQFDVAGAFTSTFGMAALVYGFVQAATDGWGARNTVGSFATGAVLLAVFVLTELRARAPITPLRLFADRGRSIAYAARLLLVAGMFGMFFFLTQFLQDVLGYSPLLTGVGFLPLTATLFASSQVGARLSSRVPGRRLMLIGFTTSAVGLLWVSRLSVDSGYLSILGPLLLVGVGNGLAFVPLTALSLSGVDHRDAGAASGLINVTQQVGGALGLAVLVTVFGTASRSELHHLGSTSAVATRAAFVYGADRAFLVAAAFLVATLALVATAERSDRPRVELVDDLELDLELAAASTEDLQTSG